MPRLWALSLWKAKPTVVIVAKSENWPVWEAKEENGEPTVPYQLTS